LTSENFYREGREGTRGKTFLATKAMNPTKDREGVFRTAIFRGFHGKKGFGFPLRAFASFAVEVGFLGSNRK
jgi:hypothetical protein